MALNIRNADAERLAATLARLTGETKTEAVTRALHCARLPVRDARTADEILGYDEHGVPR